MASRYQVLLFYKYVEIENPKEELQRQKDLCAQLNLKCRTIIASEGINGTLEGLTEDTEKYIEEMSKDPRFADIDWKRSEGTEDGTAFSKIRVKVRSEIVTLDLGETEDVGPLKKIDPETPATAPYITAVELHELLNSDEEFYIIDMRNDYEHKVGYFENSILPAMKNFRDLPQLLHSLETFKNKQVVTVCTGGIRCEKASGFLLKHGFTNVRQLYGGIVTYMEKYPNQDFKGKLYVFDKRTLMGFNVDSEEHEVVGVCARCEGKTDNYIDCNYIHCNGHRHVLLCKDCYDDKGNAFCSDDCSKKYYAQIEVFA